MPVFAAIRIGKKLVYYNSADRTSQNRPHSIGHHHKKPLRTRSYRRVTLRFNKKGTGNIEKIKRHSVNNTGQNDHPKAIARVSVSKQTKTDKPRNHTDEHHFFDTKPFQKKWNSKNKKRF